MRWAVFKDFRGVLYCEPLNEGIEVWVKAVPGRPEIRTIFGIKQEAREPSHLYHLRFLESHYSKDQYRKEAFEPAPEGFYQPGNKFYLQENLWGIVDVFHIIEDDTVGLKVQYQLRRLAPDKSMRVKDRDRDAKPHPHTDRILAMLRAS